MLIVLLFFCCCRVTWEETYGDRDILTNDENLTIWDGEWWTTEKHIYLYSILIAGLLLLIVSRSFAFYRMCLRVAINLHDKLFRGVTRATMWFFNQNSTGRILNRFSKDIGTIDSMLPVVIVDCIQVSELFEVFSWLEKLTNSVNFECSQKKWLINKV